MIEAANDTSNGQSFSPEDHSELPHDGALLATPPHGPEPLNLPEHADSIDLIPGIPAMVGGIPGSYFNPELGDGELTTPSGHRFLYSFYPELIWLSSRLVWDHRYSDYPHFQADLSKHEGEPCISFAVRKTVTNEEVLAELGMDPNNPRHEDLDPKALVGASITYFESVLGKPLVYFRGTWEEGSGSVNYQRFIDNLRTQGVENPRDATQEQMRLASMGTWTQEIAKSHGFEEIAGFTWPQGSSRALIHVYFRRPASAAEQPADAAA
ncbi:MAG TPA: hypothetical protein VLF91_00660 [Candidatus Saccharimonadales bacterium]|nr:hypothetical protein [Candidatus Saccharimonadales bacterium]